MQNTVICFDYGIKFIGVAIGQTVTKTANPLGVIVWKTDHVHVFNKLEKIFKHWKPKIIVVGLPLNMDGTSQTITKKSKLFASQLAKYFKLPYELQDERLTTYEAINYYKSNRSTYKYKYYDILQGIIITNKFNYCKNNIIDALSASIILEDWLNK